MRTRQTQMRFTDADLSLLDQLCEHLDQPTKTSLVRHLARQRARELGLPVPPVDARGPGRPKVRKR